MSLEEKARLLAEQEKRSDPIDWPAERDWWLSRLKELHEEVTRWLAPLVSGGLLKPQTDEVQLSEEHIGTYRAPRLVLEFSGEAVVLEPQGTRIIGSHGRVNVFRRGQRGQQIPMLILMKREDQSGVWTIWPTRNPRDRKPWNEDNFKALVDSLL